MDYYAVLEFLKLEQNFISITESYINVPQPQSDTKRAYFLLHGKEFKVISINITTNIFGSIPTPSFQEGPVGLKKSFGILIIFSFTKTFHLT